MNSIFLFTERGCRGRTAATFLPKSLLAIVWAIGLGNPSGAELSPQAGVIPRPVSLKSVVGEDFLLSGDLVVVGDKELATVAMQTARALGAITGHQPAVREQGVKGPRIQFVLNGKKSATVVGAYRLRVRTADVLAEADSLEGLFHAAQTLRQLATRAPDSKEWTIPLVDIVDEPRFRWRGLLIDVAAHFYPKAEIKQIIDNLAYYKMNVLHLHLTDNGGWRVEIPQYPRLTAIGGKGNLDTPGVGEPLYYTAADLREIVAYAAENFVTVVPEIEMPGHAAAAARAYPEYFDGDGTFNPAAPGVYDFIAGIVGEVARQCPGPFVHFGGDEVSTDRWSDRPDVKTFMQAQGLKTVSELQRYFYQRVAKIIRSAGRRPMAWDEAAEAGVGKDVLIQWWRKGFPGVRDEAFAQGYELVFSPVDQIYLDYAAGPGEPGAPWEGNDNGPTSVEKILRWEPVPGGLADARAAKVAGIEAALWTEFIRTKGFLQFMLYPRLMAVAEVAWSPQGPREAQEFQRRLIPHLTRLRALGINARDQPGDAYQYLIH